MKFVENYISPFIESQFPSFYREEGPMFILFVKAYYEWLESNGQTLNYSRNLPEYRDIDTTIDDFLSHFKYKYLHDFPYDVLADKRLLIKHIQDLYRTKGTEQGVNLLFRLLYNVQSNVYYPGDDIMKLSSGTWKVPEYIEVSPSSYNYQLVNKLVIGTTSGATAFVERIVKKRVQGKFIDVLYISARNGNFVYNERVVIQANPIIEGAPKIIGSLSTLVVTNGGEEYNIGDVLNIVSGSGQQGKALVTGVSTQTGRVNFAIDDGGYGYTANAEVLVSQRNLTFTNTTNANNSITGFQRFETIRQPLRTVSYSTTSNAYLFAVGGVVENYYSNGVVSANATIIYNEPTTAANGTMIVVPNVGEINTDATFSLHGNSVTGVISTYTDSSATGNVMFTTNTSMGVTHITNSFVAYPGNYIVGLTSNTYANVSVRSSGVGATFSVGKLQNTETVLLFSDLLRANNSGNVSFMSIKLDGSNSNVAANGYGFTKYPAGTINTTLQNLLTFGTKTVGEIAVLSRINPGEEYNTDPYVYVVEPEVASLEKHDVGLKISTATGLFIPNEIVEMSANSIGQQLTVTSFTGTAANGVTTNTAEINELVWQSNGSANVATGYVNQINIIGGSGTLRLSNTTGTFTNAYGIHTLTTNATATVSLANTVTIVSSTIGRVKTANTTALKVRRLSLNNEFYSGYTVLGRTSGAVATIIDASDDNTALAIGTNAIIAANVQVANTVVANLQVLDSGFGYVENETVALVSPTNEYEVTAKVVLTNQGFSEGYYDTEQGFLDGSSKIYDGDYYQDYSYEVQTRLPLNKYADILKNVVHTAGTRFFGKVVFDSYADKQFNSIIAPQDRSFGLHIANGQGSFMLGDTVSQGNTIGVLFDVKSNLTISNNNPYIESGTLATSGNNVVLINTTASSNTTTTLYCSLEQGTVDANSTLTAVIGRTIGIANVHQGNTVTGSFAVGEVLHQYNDIGAITGTGTVFTANSTNITIRLVDGTISTNTSLRGISSNAYANVVSIANTTATYTVVSAINTLYISNTTNNFTVGTISGANASIDTATVNYVDVTLDT